MESQQIETAGNTLQSNSVVTVQSAGSLQDDLLDNEQTSDLVQASIAEGRTASNGRQEIDEHRVAGAAALAVLLGQLVGYFSGHADVDDLDVLSFSLHHLFCRLDLLFRQALPSLMQATQSSENAQVPGNYLLTRQQVWNQLHIINRALDRMEPLCHLLSDATECILDAFDSSSSMILAAGSEQPQASASPGTQQLTDEQDWPRAIDQEHWQRALTTITENLMRWEACYQNNASFSTQFAYVTALAASSLSQLDSAFATLLDSAGAIFGDILPSFRTVSLADDAAIAALLFDLMQQSDQLLVQFEITLEPINALLQQFSIRNAAV